MKAKIDYFELWKNWCYFVKFKLEQLNPLSFL